MHGTRTANYAMDNADLIVCVGARFDDRITGKLSEFAPRAKFVHIDIDPAEISKNVPAHIPIVGDAKQVLPKLTKEYRALQADRSRLDEWWKRIREWQKDYPLGYERSETGEIKPQAMVEAMYKATEGDAIITSDVGQHQMWAAQYYHFDKPRRWINSGGLGTMGFGLPAAIGAQVAYPDDDRRLPRRRRQPDHDLPGAGDRRPPRDPGQGLPDEQRLLRHGPPVAGAVLGRALLARSRWAPAPTGSKLAEAFGATGMRVDDAGEVEGAMRDALADRGPGPARRARSTQEENCYPMIPAGAAARDMVGGPEPAAKEGAEHGSRHPRPDQARGPRRRRRPPHRAASTCSRSWSRTGRASWRGSPACSAAAASTSTRSPSGPPRTRRSRASR